MASFQKVQLANVNDKYRYLSVHGDREQSQREEAINDFKSGKMPILVIFTTDHLQSL
jgi:superfamily II DNA/RNA helicase